MGLKFDPRKLGKLAASGLNAKRYKVFVVHPDAGLTPEALQANPAWTGEKSIAIAEGPDAGGKADVALEPLKKEILGKIRSLGVKHGAPLKTFVVGFSATGEAKAIAGPTLELDYDVIPVGSAICPPRPTDEAKERAWYARLEEVTLDDLQPGDILIRKAYDGGMVVLAQLSFQAERGSKFSSHAMLYVGGGQVCHAYEVPMAVGYSAPTPGATIIAWRPTDPAQARASVETARWLASSGLKYSVEHCVGTAPHSSSWGPEAQKRADMVARRERPTHRTMCSEFVSYCYQGLRGNPWIKLDAMRVSPMRLEDHMNLNPDRFRFAGAVRTSGKETITTAELAKKAVENIGGEIKDRAEQAGKKIESAASDAKKEISSAANQAKKGISSAANKAKDKLKKLF